MKLVLANGTYVKISTFTQGSVVLNGDTVPSISLVITGQSLETVKDLFNAEENITQFNIYDENKVLLLVATGYQKRVSIALGQTDSEFIVTVAKASNASELLKAVDKRITEVAKTLESHNSMIDATSKNIDSLSNVVAKVVETHSNISKQISMLTETIDSVKENNTITNNTINRLSDTVRSVSQGFSDVTKLVTDMSSKIEGVTNSLVATNKTSAAAASNSARVENIVNSQITVIDNISGKMKDVESTTKATNELQNQITKTVDTLSNTQSDVVNSVKTLKQTTSVLSTNMDDVVKSTKSAKENASIAKNKAMEASMTATAIQNDLIPTLTKKIDDTAEAANSIDSNTTKAIEEFDKRVAALEPVTDYTTLDLDSAKTMRIAESKQVLAEYLEANPITSTCHGGVEERYSITSEKQAYLQAMILTSSMAKENGVEYQPSWNAAGKACTYDWTLEELQQLAMEIEAAVRPLVSHQQKLECQIKEANTMDELKGIKIEYPGV